MMINQTKYHWLMALPALLLAVGCSESILPEGQDTGVAELQVSPQVVLTRGAIDAVGCIGCRECIRKHRGVCQQQNDE